jgi:hypothetical protein
MSTAKDTSPSDDTVSLTLPETKFIFELAEKLDISKDITSILDYAIASQLNEIVSQLKDLGFEALDKSNYYRTARFISDSELDSLNNAHKETGLSTSKLLSACILRLRRQNGLMTFDNKIDPVDKICNFLKMKKVRATYGAVCEYLGGYSPQMLMKTKPKLPVYSWVVNSQSKMPTGYKLHQIDPDLTLFDRVLENKSQIEELMRESEQV